MLLGIILASFQSVKLSPYDLVLYPIYFGIVYALGNNYRKRLASNPVLFKYYGQALSLKMISSFLFCMVYMYYYNGGDTTGYYHWCDQWLKHFFKDPGNAITFLFSGDIGPFYRFVTSSDWGAYLYLMKFGSNEVYFLKIAAIINVIGLNSFVCTSLLFGYLAFLGSWRLFIVFYDMYPHLSKQLAIATLFIPSVVFWSSGLMKDTLSYMGICWLTYTLYFGIIKRQRMVKNAITSLLLVVMIGKLKGYIILSYIPAAGYWLFAKYKEKIQSPVLRFVTGPFFIIGAVVLSVFLLSRIGDSLGKYSLDKLEQTAEGYQSWHQATGGASYTIEGVGDFSITGLVKILPQGIIVTLFRPFLWEAGSVFNLLASIEGLIFFFLTLRVLWQSKIIRLPEALALDSNIIFCFIFALILAFAVGITSFNFGALVRYKIPIMPFYAIGLIIIEDVLKRKSLLGSLKN
ncbi:MAG: hypothetical protein KF872_00455 [Chitinophagales bacterium]|nr:hypothetical protein [Chitinophagales bacterium]